jgi:hypothetical protein
MASDHRDIELTVPPAPEKQERISKLFDIVKENSLLGEVAFEDAVIVNWP